MFNSPLNFTDPSGLDCYSSQSSGTTICSNMDGEITMINEGGYAGAGDGINNPSMQHIPDVGLRSRVLLLVNKCLE